MEKKYTYDFLTKEGIENSKVAINKIIAENEKEELSKIIFFLMKTVCTQQVEIVDLQEEIKLYEKKLSELWQGVVNGEK